MNIDRNYNLIDNTSSKKNRKGIMKKKKDQGQIKKVKFSDNSKIVENFDLNEISNKINEVKKIKEQLENNNSNLSEDNDSKIINQKKTDKNNKFSFIKFILKIILLILFSIIIYISYTVIFKKKKFKDVFNEIKNSLNLKKNKSSQIETNPSLDLNQNIGSVSENMNTPKMEITKINPTLKGGQSYIDEKSLVNDIINILDQFK